MVGEHRDHLRVELSPAPAPEQVDQAVVVARDEDRHTPALAPEAQLPVHLEALRDLPGEALPQPLARAADSRTPPRKNSVRRKKRPPSGSEEYWWEETMFAPCSNRKPETAATIPGYRDKRSAAARCSRARPAAAAPAIVRRRQASLLLGRAVVVDGWPSSACRCRRISRPSFCRSPSSCRCRSGLPSWRSRGIGILLDRFELRLDLLALAAGVRLTAFSAARSPTLMLCAL